jgi:hypothetical protein
VRKWCSRSPIPNPKGHDVWKWERVARHAATSSPAIWGGRQLPDVGSGAMQRLVVAIYDIRGPMISTTTDESPTRPVGREGIFVGEHRRGVCRLSPRLYCTFSSRCGQDTRQRTYLDRDLGCLIHPPCAGAAFPSPEPSMRTIDSLGAGLCS